MYYLKAEKKILHTKNYTESLTVCTKKIYQLKYITTNLVFKDLFFCKLFEDKEKNPVLYFRVYNFLDDYFYISLFNYHFSRQRDFNAAREDTKKIYSDLLFDTQNEINNTVNGLVMLYSNSSYKKNIFNTTFFYYFSTISETIGIKSFYFLPVSKNDFSRNLSFLYKNETCVTNSKFFYGILSKYKSSLLRLSCFRKPHFTYTLLPIKRGYGLFLKTLKEKRKKLRKFHKLKRIKKAKTENLDCIIEKFEEN